MNEAQSSPPQSDSQRLAKLPSTLTAYANDIDKHGAALDSGLPEILRFLSKQIPIERNHAQRLADALAQALNDINTARRHVYTGSSANPDDMTFDAIENTLEPAARIAREALAQWNKESPADADALEALDQLEQLEGGE